MNDKEHETWARASQYATPRDAALLRLLDAARETIAERDRRIPVLEAALQQLRDGAVGYMEYREWVGRVVNEALAASEVRP